MLIIKVINKSSNPLPSYETDGSSGMDLRAFIGKQVVLAPMQRIIITTGLYFEIPFGYEGQIRTRSGLAYISGIVCLNSPGTIDADYRGEIKVLVINLSKENQVINNGDRVAQIIFQKVEKVSFN